MTTSYKGKITVAFTGASGMDYGLKLVEQLLTAHYQVFLLISSAARVVIATETQLKLPSQTAATHKFLINHWRCKPDDLVICGKTDWFSPVASGSAAPKQMIICPCSAGSMAAIAHGMSDNLIERAADVVIKERGQLVLVVRETPLSTIHLENMHKLSSSGVTIMPAAPGFYHGPKSIDDLIDFMVARVLDHIGIEHSLMKRWGYKNVPN